MNPSPPQRRLLLPRVIHAGIWALAFQSTDQLLLFARIVVLTIFLGPADFGLFGIAIVSMTTLDTISRLGVNSALVQKGGDIASYLDVAWTLQVVRAVLAAGALWVMAPSVAAFFDAPDARPLIRALAVAGILQGLVNPAVLYFHRNLEFQRDFRFRVSGALADLTTSVVTAVLVHSAWALVLGLIARNLTMLIASYLMLNHRPRVSLDYRKLNELLDFGMWIWLTGIATLIAAQIANVVVGKVLGVAALGLFQMAQRIPGLVLRQGLIDPMTRVAFAAYAKIHHDVDRLKAAFLRVLSVWAAITMPIAGGISAVGLDFTRICLGEKWMPMVPALIIASVAFMLGSLIATASPLFMGQGRPRLAFHLKATECLAIMCVLYPLVSNWGIVGAAVALLVGNVVTLVAWYVGIRRRLDLSRNEVERAILPPLSSTVVMVAVVVVLRYLTVDFLPDSQSANLLWFATLISVGVAVYFASMQACRSVFPDYEPFEGLVEGFRG